MPGDFKYKEMNNMTEQELTSEGCGLWYVVLNHSNHRFVNASGEPFIYDDIETVKAKAEDVTQLGYGEFLPMMVKDFNLKYKKHME